MEVVKTVVSLSHVSLFVCLVCANFFTEAQIAIDKDSGFSTKDAVDFMAKFGYLQIDNNNDGPQALIDPNSMSDALKTVQSFGGIPQTGLLDEATIKLMQIPRCGVPDILPNNRKKREIPWSYGWNKAFITYFVGETFKISRDLARIEIKDAFEKWEKYSRLKFIETSDKEKADIVILFKSGSHGDGNPFDGKGYILAHAFGPSDYHGISGDIHFDNDENWAIDSNRHDITDFFSVAIHEIGHSLGFSHTQNKNSVMFSSYQLHDKRTFQFTEDIIRGLYEMYLLNRKIDWSNSYSTSTTFRPRTEWTSTTTRPRAEWTSTTTRPRAEWTSTTTRPRNEWTPSTTHRPRTEWTSTTTRPRNEWTPSTTSRPRTEWTSTTTRPRAEWTSTTTRPRNEWTPSTTSLPRTEWTSTTIRTRPYSEPKVPSGTVSYENDSETVEKHKEHDSSHKIPQKTDPVLHCEKEVASTPPDFCDGHFDSVANIRRELYVFKQGYMYRLKDRGQPYGEPQKYQFSFFRNKATPMLNCMDAVYERPNDHRFVIFTGTWYWVFDDFMNMLENSPQPITKYGLPQYVTKINAAMVKDGKTYLFVEDRYWRYNDEKRKMDEGYPRPISFFLGLPTKIDAAFTWNDNTTYFFKDNKFWSLNNTWKRVENLHGQTASKFWLNCDR